MIVTQTCIRTANASKYLIQLSKHWSHRLPDLTYTREQVTIPLALGLCALKASGEMLDITVSTAEEADSEKLQQVVIEHLLRFAHRETLDVLWTRST